MNETTRSMTRERWESTVATRRDILGGDLWNEHNIWRQAFTAEPRAIAVRYDYIGTGLWCDVVVTLADGGQVARRIFG